FGLKTEFIQIDPAKPTSTVPVTLDAAGNPTFEIVEDVAWDYLDGDDPAWRRLADADLICFGTLAQRSEPGRRAIQTLLEASRGTKLYDVNLRPPYGSIRLVRRNLTYRAKELSKDAMVTIEILGFGDARVQKAHMPMAVVPAAAGALAHAGVELSEVKAIKTHNPFAVNDVFFCRETDLPPESLNRYGSPLIYGHPQGPTGTRAILELIEELVEGGGGLGLFSGCAAGDTAMAMVLRVD
ncbi:MAG: hypothetical protein ACE5F1_16480, partial [Planctomycetota bacterium]